MHLVADILVGLVALLHAWFLVLEMFLWDKPLGRKVFRLKPEFASASKYLAMNQGLYNGFIVAGLVWGLCVDDLHIKVFFLACVIVADIFGAVTVSRKVFFVQALPAVVALVLLHIP